MVGTTLMEKANRPFFVLIHNLDGPALRSAKQLTALSVLAACPRVHVIASMDHLKALLLFDSAMTRRFGFVYRDLTTYAPYHAETRFEMGNLWKHMSLQGDLGGGKITMRSVQFVLRSLPKNSKDLFKTLAQYQVDNDEGMPEMSLLGACQRQFFAGSLTTFRAQLNEFYDHGVIVKRRCPIEDADVLTIPLDADSLSRLLEEMDE